METENSPGRQSDRQHAAPDAVFSIDAKYTVIHTEEGVIFDAVYETGSGAPLNPEFVIFDLERRGIEGLNITDVLMRLRKRESSFKLAEPQEQKTYDSDVAASIARDEMSASMMLFPPSPQGKVKSPQEVKDILAAKWNITAGLDDAAVTEAVEAQDYYRLLPIAAGRPPIRGKDGSLTFMFKTEHNYAPRLNVDGTADYKNLDLFESVRENDVVVVAVPPEEGTDGFTVKGKVLPAQKGAAVRLPKGKNVKESEDGLSLIAAKSGRVDYIGGRVEISDVYNVRGDVDMGVGNIDFAGDLLIQGNIIAGLTIKADGNIEVHGTVEASTLIAGKDIILKNGIQGMDKAVLQAGGNIVARFIERCKVTAGGSVFSDYIAHSTVNAAGSVTMRGRHGKIIGGTVRAGREIIAKTIGSPSSDPTHVEVGVSPEMRVRLAELENKHTQLKNQMDKMENIARIMPASGAETPEKAAMRQKLIDLKAQLVQSYEDNAAEIERIKAALAQKSGGKVHVSSTVYQNAKIVIDSIQYPIKSSLDFVTFRYREGEVVFSACEIKLN